MRTPDLRPGYAMGADDECLAGWPGPQPIADIVREALNAELRPAWRALRLAESYDTPVSGTTGQPRASGSRPDRGGRAVAGPAERATDKVGWPHPAFRTPWVSRGGLP